MYVLIKLLIDFPMLMMKYSNAGGTPMKTFLPQSFRLFIMHSVLQFADH
jgi:hypothetical protein